MPTHLRPDRNGSGNVVYLKKGSPPPPPTRYVPPTVETKRVHHRCGDVLVVEKCCYCGQRHLHGPGSKTDCGNHGHRVADCDIRFRPNRGYYVFEPCPPRPRRTRRPRGGST